MKKQKNLIILTIVIMLITLILPITSKGAETEIEWTDFSNAKFEIVPKRLNNNSYNYSIKVSNVTLRNDRKYSVKFHAKDEEMTNNKILFNSDALFENGTDTAPITTLFGNILEKKDDIYFSILENTNAQDPTNSHKIVLTNKKVDRPQLLPTLGNRVNIYFSKTNTNTFPWFPHNSKLSRKINVKIGEITNLQLVKDIRDKKSGALENLLAYAKKMTNYNYTGTIVYDLDKTSGITESLTSKMNLKDKVYYFAYIQLDDEGIYYPVEDIALYQASGTLDLKHYLKDTLSWNDIENNSTSSEKTNNNGSEKDKNKQNQVNNNKTNETKKDQTVAKDKIPQTGEAIGYTLVTILFILVASIGYIKFKQYKDIK